MLSSEITVDETWSSTKHISRN